MNIKIELNKLQESVNIKKTFSNYDTLEILDLERINNEIKNCEGDLIISGFKMNKNSQRYKLFIRDEQKCIVCGAKASFWALQRTGNAKIPHLNLWGFDKYGNTLLFTKDHIIPKSLGGENKMDNYQIMCDVCNRKKGNGTPQPHTLSKKKISKKCSRGDYLEYLEEGVEVHKRNFKKFCDGEKSATIIKTNVLHPINNKESCLLSNGCIIDNRGLIPSFVFNEIKEFRNNLDDFLAK